MQTRIPLILIALLGGMVLSRHALAQTMSLEDQHHIESTIDHFMQDFDVPGLSIAVSKEGQLVLNRGFGYVDKANKIPVTPEHRFRIASLSKPITSVAIHRLIQEGKLSYDAKVFGPDSLLGDGSELASQAGKLSDITVEHLLTHTVGAWGNKKDDPMFLQQELGHQELIDWTLRHQPLELSSGETYAYSNFGYCLLGRVIEKVSGKPYREFVKQDVLDPIGATSFEIAGDTLQDRLSNEVIYYGDAGQNPYGMNAARMDAHGGWVATAEHLVQFAMHCDGFPNPRDQLSPKILRQMVTPSEANENYAKGWSINRFDNWWHTGSLPGTGAILVRASNGHCWAVLVNTRSTKPGFFKALDKLPWEIVRGVKSWQTPTPRGDGR